MVVLVPVALEPLPVPELSVPATEPATGAVVEEPEGLGVELGFTELELEPQADNTMSALTGKRSLTRISPSPLRISLTDDHDNAKIGLAKDGCPPIG